MSAAGDVKKQEHTGLLTDEKGAPSNGNGASGANGTNGATGGANGSGAPGGPEIQSSEVHEDHVDNQCFVECMTKYVTLAQPHYRKLLIILGVFFAGWMAVYGYSLHIYAIHRKDEFACLSAPIVKWLLFDSIIGFLFWGFAAAVVAILPITFKHLPQSMAEEFHDSFFGLYCAWLLWIIFFMVLLTMKIVASLWFFHHEGDFLCLSDIYSWSYWLIIIGWVVQGGGVIAFIAFMLWPILKDRFCPNKYEL